MQADGHQQAYEELRTARSRLLLPEDVRAYTELSLGMAFHLIAVGAQRRHGLHRENHQGLVRWLHERGDTDIAAVLEEIENMRTGRWYGRQGDGDAVARIDELLAQCAQWAVATGGR